MSSRKKESLSLALMSLMTLLLFAIAAKMAWDIVQQQMLPQGLTEINIYAAAFLGIALFVIGWAAWSSFSTAWRNFRRPSFNN